MLTLRPATFDDWARLYAWRNDPATRASSTRSEQVPLADHLHWLQATLNDAAHVRLWVAYDQSIDAVVGTCRHNLRNDAHGSAVELSLTVDPAHRGRGYATQMIGALLASIPHEWRGSGVERCLARVQQSNHASLRAFAEHGFTPCNPSEPLITLERPLGAAEGNSST
jgi:RimJ/RimL family protein N-acetyltransferase